MFACWYRLAKHCFSRTAILLLLAGFLAVSFHRAEAQQEPPYFVTYSSVMEEPGNLEIENQNIAAAPKNANGFLRQPWSLNTA